MKNKLLVLSILVFCQQSFAAACLVRESEPNKILRLESFNPPFYGLVKITSESNAICTEAVKCKVSKGDAIEFNLDGSITWNKIGTSPDIKFDTSQIITETKTKTQYIKLTSTSGNHDLTAYLLYVGPAECSSTKDADQCRQYVFEIFPERSPWKTPEHPESKWTLGGKACSEKKVLQPGGGGGEEEPTPPP